MDTLPFNWQNTVEIDQSSGCIYWTTVDVDQSPRVWIKGKVKFAHRAAYEHFFGPVEGNNVIVRTCGNNRCINPDHLKSMKRKDMPNEFCNVEKYYVKRCRNGHEYTEGNIYLDPRGHRECRLCRHKKHAKLAKEQKKARRIRKIRSEARRRRLAATQAKP